jgi:hypothetical protein
MQQSPLPSKKQMTRELAILNTPTYREARPAVVSYVERLQASRSANDLRPLHRDLIVDVNAHQKALKAVLEDYRPRARADIQRLRNVIPQPIRKLAAANRLLRGADHAERVADALQHAMRVLADGMVWAALDYDRATISVLGKDQPVAHHADDMGFMAELGAIGLVEAESGHLTFHNDTTNVLRKGDITSIVEIDGTRFPVPREVKVGAASATKQVARIQAALDTIRTRRLLLPVPFDTHMAVLAELIAEAKRTGYARAKLDCQFVQVTDYRHWGGRDQELEQITQQSLRELGWAGDDRLILAGLSSVSRICDRGDPVVELAPISIFPLPADDVADLLLGFLGVSVHLNTQLLGLRFAQRRIAAQFMTAPASHVHFVEARRGYRGLLVPAYVREQMLHELMTVDTLVELADWILSSGMTRDWTNIEQTPIIGFENERAVWSPTAKIELAA